MATRLAIRLATTLAIWRFQEVGECPKMQRRRFTPAWAKHFGGGGGVIGAAQGSIWNTGSYWHMTCRRVKFDPIRTSWLHGYVTESILIPCNAPIPKMIKASKLNFKIKIQAFMGIHSVFPRRLNVWHQWHTHGRHLHKKGLLAYVSKEGMRLATIWCTCFNITQ